MPDQSLNEPPISTFAKTNHTSAIAVHPARTAATTPAGRFARRRTGAGIGAAIGGGKPCGTDIQHS
ncbi:hypothetical protein [Amycolatopsis sp. NBC_01480]|uniref:hypothetical protein n=1 Tax=Amycolatopsis sp. NBC_01480 TaxID=2903562 RepID=UPI002E2C9AD8|nr:hypothetical protein [Amycolatopsis sp. NBC_01480]